MPILSLLCGLLLKSFNGSGLKTLVGVLGFKIFVLSTYKIVLIMSGKVSTSQLRFLIRQLSELCPPYAA